MKRVTTHFMQKGLTGLPRWQVENVVRSYIQVTGKESITNKDFQSIEELIRKKEVGGKPGTNVKLSPKGPPPDRARSVLYGLDQSAEKPIEISLKQSSVAKLPALK